jgi:hypothetical protein
MDFTAEFSSDRKLHTTHTNKNAIKQKKHLSVYTAKNEYGPLYYVIELHNVACIFYFISYFISKLCISNVKSRSCSSTMLQGFTQILAYVSIKLERPSRIVVASASQRNCWPIASSETHAKWPRMTCSCIRLRDVISYMILGGKSSQGSH